MVVRVPNPILKKHGVGPTRADVERQLHAQERVSNGRKGSSSLLALGLELEEQQ